MYSSKGEPNHYLGNYYKKDKEGQWFINWKKYLTEAIFHIASNSGDLLKNNTLIQYGNHPEVDNSILLNDE